MDGKGRPKLKRFLCDVKDGVPYNTLWTDLPMGTSGTSEIQNLFGSINEFDTAKPERLIQEILNLATQPDDLVLDFFMGSGTTAAVAHKMGRRYIGIEQMDYIETISVVRLQKVIGSLCAPSNDNTVATKVHLFADAEVPATAQSLLFDNGGISKLVNWQGGGSFVYMELAQANQYFVEQIKSAETEADLWSIKQRLDSEAFISYKIKLDSIDKNAKDYEALSLTDKKRFLINCLDANLLYVPYCDMESQEFGMSETDKAATRSFYNLI
jgi:adenine-specific DNA-methyltransferase